MIKSIISLFLTTTFLLFFIACNPFSRKAKPVTELPIAQTAKKISVEINSPKLNVIITTVRLFVDSGFPIIYTDEKIGLITTDFTKLKMSFGGELNQRLFGTEDFELRLTAYISSSEKRFCPSPVINAFSIEPGKSLRRSSRVSLAGIDIAAALSKAFFSFIRNVFLAIRFFRVLFP